MKFLVGIVIGILVGYKLGRGALERPEAAAQAVARGRGLVNGATRIGLSAVQAARAQVQSRLSGDGEAAWN